jgi:nitrite reductase/ring-hydroxylating ferredoxin subunit
MGVVMSNRRPKEIPVGFTRLVAVDQCREGAGAFVEHHGRELAVFLLGDSGGVVVMDNACPHASGNLSGGEVVGNTVSCPWHHWEFDLATGVCTHSPLARVRRYPAEIRAGAVWADFGA